MLGVCEDERPLPLGAGQVCEQGSGRSALRTGLTGSEPRVCGVAQLTGRCPPQVKVKIKDQNQAW